MKLTKSAKIATFVGLFLVGVSLYGRKKYTEAEKVLSNLKFSIGNLSNLKLEYPFVDFSLKLKVENPTNINFGATLSSKITIVKVQIFSDTGKYLAEAFTNINKVDLPAGTVSNFSINNVKIDLDTALSELGTNINSYLQNDFSKLNFKIFIDAFGKMITLDV